MVAAPTAVEIFCSYAYEDEAWLRKLETHLSPLKRQGFISLWNRRLIIPGTNWADAINTHLETASIILLLVSADFMASDYCYSVEMKRALERHRANEARVIPILMRPVSNWTETPFAQLQILPTNAKPIASWRNKDTALTDVVAGIRRVLEDLPLFVASAPRAALPPIWNIPYPRNPFFLGRESELTQVRQRLQAGQSTHLFQPQAISGLGGIGKTQLALEYAYRYHQDYTVVLWAQAESTEVLISSYISLATLLGLPEREAREQEVMVQAVKAWLQTHSGWLLILDNADELNLLPDFLPSTTSGHLLLTTRAAATGRLAHRLEIESLLPEQGALFLLRRAALIAPDAPLEQASPHLQGLALQISLELGGLPLALDQAGAYLEETGMGLAGYWQIYQQHRTSLLQRRGGLVADHRAPVATTWSLSFQKVEEKNAAAAELLCICAYLAPDAIPEEILTTGVSFLSPALSLVAADAFLFNQAIEVLRSYSLVQRYPQMHLLSIHRVLQAVLQDELEEAEQRSWAERAILVVNAAFPANEHGTWQQCERLLSHALLVAQWSERYQINRDEVGRLLDETASYLRDHARYQEAERLYQSVLHIWEQKLGPNHSQIAYSLNGLARLYRAQSKYAEAERLYQRALNIWEQQIELDHLQVASLLTGLALVFQDQIKYTEAELFYERALNIWEQQSKPEHPQTVYPLNGLASLFYKQGKYTEAEIFYQRALNIWEHQPEKTHPDLAYPLNGLAILYLEQGKHAVAEPLFLRALSIWEQRLGLEHPQVAHSLNGLANLYRELGRYAEAEPLFLRALRIYEQQLGPEHEDLAYPLNNLAIFYYDQGKYAEAELLYHRALRIFERQLGETNINTALSLNNLAELYGDQGKYAEAEPLLQRAQYIFEQQLGETHPLVAHPLNGLANLYREQERYAEAERLYLRALSIRKQALGPQHPDMAETMQGLARLREVQGNSEEACVMYTRTLEIRELALGALHPKTIETRMRFIALLHTMGQHNEAARLEAPQPES